MARRPYAGAELSRRLVDMGYEADAVKPALETFAELGYIDDATFAENLVRRRSSKRGPRAIAAELTAKGVEADVVQRAVGRFDREAQVQAAMRLIRRVPGSSSTPTYEQLLELAAPKLLRRGFSHAIVWAACRAIWGGAADAVGV